MLAEGAAVVCSSLSSRRSVLDEGTNCFMLLRPFLHGERDSEIACMMMVMMVVVVIFSVFSAVNCRSEGVHRKHPSLISVAASILGFLSWCLKFILECKIRHNADLRCLVVVLFTNKYEAVLNPRLST